MQCTYVGCYVENHSKRRRLMGSELDRAVSSMLVTKTVPSVYRKDEANRLMVEGILLLLNIIILLE